MEFEERPFNFDWQVGDAHVEQLLVGQAMPGKPVTQISAAVGNSVQDQQIAAIVAAFAGMR